MARLRGVLKDAGLVGEGDYAAHLEEKHLRDGEAHEDARGHKRRGPLRRPSAKRSEQDGDEQPGILDLFGTLEWDESYDYKLERSRRLRSRRQAGSPE
ncbi:MAG: hypothetical protein F4210_04360 [Holophagales bacterium]|nr:hypothetical protein [Holophagales bacterium]